MTTPVPADLTIAPTLIDSGTQALLTNAKRLGLAWNMTSGTVTRGTDPTKMLVVCDGDTVPIIMQSMIGTQPVNTRVYVIQIPGTGTNYVAGVCGIVNNGNPIAYLAPTTTQSIAAASQVAIVFGANPIDTAGGWVAALPTRYSVSRAGYYRIEGTIYWAASNAYALFYRVNGSTLIPGSSYDQTNTTIQGRSVIWYLAQGDYVELIAFQNTGAPRNTQYDGTNLQLNTSFLIEYLRPA